MYIQSYQIHNVLEVYRKQLSRISGQNAPPLPSGSSVRDRVEFSGNGQRQALIDQVATEIVDHIAQNGPQNRFEETLLRNMDRPRGKELIRSAAGDFEFTYMTIDENDQKTINSLPIRHFNPLIEQQTARQCGSEPAGKDLL